MCMLQRRKEVCLPRVVGTPFMLRPDTTRHMQVEHTPHIGPPDVCREQVCKARDVHAGSGQAQTAPAGPTLAEVRPQQAWPLLSCGLPLLSP